MEYQHGIVYIACLIGTFIGSGLGGTVEFLITSLIFIAAILILKPKYRYWNAERNEKQKLGIYIIVSTALIQGAKLLFGIFLVYDLLVAIILTIMIYIFYKIFVNAIAVIKEYGKKQAFSIEEVIAASLLLGVALASLSSLKILGLSITNIRKCNAGPIFRLEKWGISRWN